MLRSSSNMSSSSNSSDSEEFYDAEDITNLDIASRRYRKSRGSSTQTLVEETDATNTHDRDFVFTHPPPASKGKHIFNELRQKLQTDDDDVQVTNLTPPNSQTSSMDGVYAASVSRTTHPFKVIEMDSLSLQSVNSVGRMGRILTSQSDIDTVMEEKQRAKATSMSAISTSSQESSATTDSSSGKQQVTTGRYVSTATLLQQPVAAEQLQPPQVMSPVFLPPPEQRLALQEPDVIASAKLSVLKTSGNNVQDVPVAPPRRKRKQTTDSASMTPSTSFLTDSPHNPDNPPQQIPPKPSSQEKPKITATTSTYQLASTGATSHTTMKGNNNTSTGSSQSLQMLAAAAGKTGSIKSTHSSTSNRNTLDIRQIMEGGQFVVKPQDVDRSRIDHVSVSSRTTPTRSVINGAGGKLAATGGGVRETVNRGSVGQYSLGSQRACHKQQQHNRRKSTERRKSAGDENLLRMTEGERQQHQQSPKCHNPISDYEILEKVTVLNLDTGERVPLSVAEDKLPQCINPLSLHIMRLTSEYISSNAANRHHHNDKDGRDSDEESIITTNSTETTNSRHSHFLPDGGSSSRSTATLLQGTGPGSIAGMDDITDDLLLEEEDGVGGAVDVGGAGGGAVRRKTARIKKFLGSTVKKTMHKAKSIAQEVSHARHKEDVMDLVDEVNPQNEGNVKLKAANSHKGPYDFENVHHVQELKEHDGPIWCMKFSCCGRLLATAGQDKILRIWILKDAVKNFQDMRRKYNADKVSPTPSQESLASHNSYDAFSKTSSHQDSVPPSTSNEDTSSANASCIFMPQPFCTYSGHTSDIMDVSWSKNYFILSSSMDKTVRLWHISRKECLCCFQHIDFVTAIVFHPRDDRYFLSGSLDGKLRLWNIPDKKVAVWNEIADGSSKLITAANFCQNGKFAVVGAYDGRCIFYHSDQLKYHTQISVRSTRGKNATGRKISGIEPMPGEDKILVTSNDSRIRLYDLRDLNLSCKYKGYVNVSSQIKGSFSHDGKYIICGSENRDIFIWKTSHDYSKFSSVRRDRNDFWEAIKAHNALVTCAIFAPNPDSIISSFEKSAENESEKKSDGTKNEEDPMVQQRTKGCGGYVIISADFNGCIKIFINKTKPKHSSLPASALV